MEDKVAVEKNLRYFNMIKVLKLATFFITTKKIHALASTEQEKSADEGIIEFFSNEKEEVFQEVNKP